MAAKVNTPKVGTPKAKRDWRAIAKSREQILRVFPKSRGLSNIPRVNETGSAAYRRLQAKRGVHHE